MLGVGERRKSERRGKNPTFAPTPAVLTNTLTWSTQVGQTGAAANANLLHILISGDVIF